MHSLIVRAPNSMFSRTARTISSGLFASMYSGYMILWSLYISGVGQNWPPVEPIIGPDGITVGPGSHPCSMAWRSAQAALFALLATTRIPVDPVVSNLVAFGAAWIARS